MAGTSQSDDHLNANQFDDEGLPGIDENYPPDHSWAAEDPTFIAGGSETQDDLATRAAREQPEFGGPSDREAVILSGTDGPTDVADEEAQLLGELGDRDPDAAISPEDGAMHIEESG
ncbi:MAG: hypothetical protein ACN4GZ_07980 [Acidimicrobiales bacterium]